MSPRLALLNGRFTSLLIGVRGRLAGSTVTPYASLYSRGVAIMGDDDRSMPPSRGLHAVIGLHGEGGEPGRLRPHAAFGAGLVSWRGEEHGEEFVVEFEAGLTIPTSPSFGILLAIRLEQLAEAALLEGAQSESHGGSAGDSGEEGSSEELRGLAAKVRASVMC